MRAYRRHLPHLDIQYAPVFLTWRLRDSLPPGRYFDRQALSSGQVFRLWDQLLDHARAGPRHMAQAELAAIVELALQANNTHSYELHAWAIMPNHVHVLIAPRLPVQGILRQWKGSTARAMNLKLGRSGPLWQEETFDRQVRDPAGFDRIVRYIENNPVSAGLVSDPADYRWSSAWRGRAGTLARAPDLSGAEAED